MFSARFISGAARDYPGMLEQTERLWLPMAATVIRATAKRDVPVDKGNLRGSITDEVQQHQAIVGTNVEYAVPVEYGTRWQRDQPYLRPAVDKNRKALLESLQRMLRDAIKRG